jgi:hypothetical protein
MLGFVLLAACGGDDDPKPMIDASTVDMSPFDAPAVCTGGTVEYLGVCTDSSQCGSCMCANFGHTMRCTIACTTGGEACPAPSSGCSSGGACRP